MVAGVGVAGEAFLAGQLLQRGHPQDGCAVWLGVRCDMIFNESISTCDNETSSSPSLPQPMRTRALEGPPGEPEVVDRALELRVERREGRLPRRVGRGAVGVGTVKHVRVCACVGVW